jgi:hypothetical protein
MGVSGRDVAQARFGLERAGVGVVPKAARGSWIANRSVSGPR